MHKKNWSKGPRKPQKPRSWGHPKDSIVTCSLLSSKNNNHLSALVGSKGFNLSSGTVARRRGKGAKRGAPYTAQVLGQEFGKVRKERFKVAAVEVKVRGLGYGRASVLKGLKENLDVVKLIDNERRPHGGCRAPKARRY